MKIEVEELDKWLSFTGLPKISYGELALVLGYDDMTEESCQEIEDFAKLVAAALSDNSVQSFDDWRKRIQAERDSYRLRLMEAEEKLAETDTYFYAAKKEAGRLAERVMELEARLALRESCVVCSASLHPSEDPPHCEGCLPTEEQAADWLESLAEP